MEGFPMKKTIFLALFMALQVPTFACEMDGSGGFMPENDMKVSVDDKKRNDMTEERFNQNIDRFVRVYKPIEKKKR